MVYDLLPIEKDVYRLEIVNIVNVLRLNCGVLYHMCITSQYVY